MGETLAVLVRRTNRETRPAKQGGPSTILLCPLAQHPSLASAPWNLVWEGEGEGPHSLSGTFRAMFLLLSTKSSLHKAFCLPGCTWLTLSYKTHTLEKDRSYSHRE